MRLATTALLLLLLPAPTQCRHRRCLRAKRACSVTATAVAVLFKPIAAAVVDSSSCSSSGDAYTVE
jgi:hypothetical protein